MELSDALKWIYFLADDIPIYRDILPVGRAAFIPAAQPFWQKWRQTAVHIEVHVSEAEGSPEVIDIIYLTRIDSDLYFASFESSSGGGESPFLRTPRTVTSGDLPRFFERYTIQAIQDSRTQEFVYKAPTFTLE